MNSLRAAAGRLCSAAVVATAIIFVALFVGASQNRPAANNTEIRCRGCHARISDLYTETAHFRTSRPAANESIEGSFEPGENILRTREPTTFFRMSRDGDEYFQTGYWKSGGKDKSRRERFDITIGSAREGQTYLFWRDGLLYQLPVSYLRGIDRWVNSPGFKDGVVNFDRVIPPECLECHATFFQLARGVDSKPFYRDNFVLGIQCEKCHGDGDRHVAFHTARPAATESRYTVNPGRLTQERRLDNCALCHSGLRTPKRAPFSYIPGSDLDDYSVPSTTADASRLDVHGNQVGLIKSSECFKQSKGMSCSTCHDVHRTERDVAAMSQKCGQCHRPLECRLSERVEHSLVDLCVDCHMPDQKSKVLSINLPKSAVSPAYRNHQIGVYPEAARDVLRRLGEELP